MVRYRARSDLDLRLKPTVTSAVPARDDVTIIMIFQAPSKSGFELMIFFPLSPGPQFTTIDSNGQVLHPHRIYASSTY